MIFWLASYPKSGNTLLRSLLSSYFFSKDSNFDFGLFLRESNLNLNLFEKLKIDTNNLSEVVKNYMDPQKLIIKKRLIHFLKTT